MVSPYNLDTLCTVPDYYFNSNLLSINEIALLRWLEINYEIAHPNAPRRLSNFDVDLRDCLVFQATIQNYIGAQSAKTIQKMHLNP